MTQSFIHHTKHLFHITALEKRRAKSMFNTFEKIILYGLKECQSETALDNKVQKLPIHKAKISLKHFYATGHIRWTLVLL
jgi:hypothetical protein